MFLGSSDLQSQASLASSLLSSSTGNHGDVRYHGLVSSRRPPGVHPDDWATICCGCEHVRCRSAPVKRPVCLIRCRLRRVSDFVYHRTSTYSLRYIKYHLLSASKRYLGGLVCVARRKSNDFDIHESIACIRFALHTLTQVSLKAS